MANDIIIASVIVFILFASSLVGIMVSNEFAGGVSTEYDTEGVGRSFIGNQTADIEDVRDESNFLSIFGRALIWDTNFHWILNIFFWILRGALVFVIFRNLYPFGSGS